MSVLLGPADADHYRKKVGKYRERWYIDPLPGDETTPATDDAWPSVTGVKTAYGKNWEYVGYRRIAEHLEEKPHDLDGLRIDDRYERIKQISKSRLRTAGNRGTDVHTMCEQKLRGTVVDDRFLSEEARTYRQAVDAFFNAYQPQLYAAELVCINRGLHDMGYGGTADAIALIHGKLYKIDWKSRGKDSDHDVYPEEVAQIGGYAGSEYIINQGANGPQRAHMPALDAGLIVSIKPDGFRAYPIDLGEAWLQFEGLHDWWTRRLLEKTAVGKPWAPVGPVDLFALIANMDADREAYEALYRAHKANWTPAATAAVKARLAATQPHLTPVR